MHSTYISPIQGAIVQRSYDGPRLTWLLAANKLEAQRRQLFRNASEEEQMLLMRHPVSANGAYAVLGLLLGALPPAAIFAKLFGYGISVGSLNMALADGALFFLCLAMNVACCLGGYAMGSALSRAALKLEHSSWIRMFVIMPLLGAAWGVITGVAGGFFFFGIGAFFGWAFGIPVGLFGFLLFAIIHRALERGGMIDARHLGPLACGIAAMITSLILGL